MTARRRAYPPDADRTVPPVADLPGQDDRSLPQGGPGEPGRMFRPAPGRVPTARRHGPGRAHGRCPRPGAGARAGGSGCGAAAAWALRASGRSDRADRPQARSPNGPLGEARGRAPVAQLQGWATSQLVSAAQLVALSQLLEPPLLAMYAV